MKFLTVAFVLLSLQSISVSSIKISPCARWEKHGTTIAGTGRSGSSLSELNEPLGIAIYNRTNDLYIADHRNARIQMLSLNNLSNETTTVVSQIYFPLDVIVDDENDQSIVYATLSVDSHVERWNPDDIVGTRISDDCNDCVSLDIDREKNIYITDTTQNCILKWSRATNRTTLVAGKAGQSGTKNDQLQTPQGIYITRDGTTVFISDSGNSRIQKWIIGEDSAVTVAGSENGTSSNETSHLQYPIGIRVDEDTQVLYIADTYNNRIVRWLLGDDHGEIIVGSTEIGNKPDQLNEPTDLEFDHDGNLFVCDSQNHRIQRFRLVENTPCPSSRTVKADVLLSLIILLLVVLSLIRT